MTRPDQVYAVKLVAANQFGITVADIDSRRRPDCIAFPRQIAMAFCVKRLGMRTTTTGEAFNRHHGDVIYALGRVETRSQLCASDRQAIESINQKLSNFLLCPNDS